jgi:hypothetical protein
MTTRVGSELLRAGSLPAGSTDSALRVAAEIEAWLARCLAGVIVRPAETVARPVANVEPIRGGAS